jgi:hypothetical protein
MAEAPAVPDLRDFVIMDYWDLVVVDIRTVNIIWNREISLFKPFIGIISF